ncbi:hypothetical protein WMF30_28165 [Sorangium sp. So ce134]
MADDDVGSKWRQAFAKGEVACEKLGAAHLLSHGIWAFKANSEGERTDLILQEPIRDIDKVERVAEGLVLTEWKLIRRESDVSRQAAQARKQAEKYGSGSLAGFELSSRRYIVLVSEKIDIRLPDMDCGHVKYHHVGICVKPRPPSTVRGYREKSGVKGSAVRKKRSVRAK